MSVEKRVQEIEKYLDRLDKRLESIGFGIKRGAVAKESKSLSAVSDPNFLDGEIGAYTASADDVRLTIKWNGRIWSFYANKSTAPVTGTQIVDLTDNTAGTANDTLQALTDPADTPATADALRDDLVANTIPEIRNNQADLAAKINEILSVLKAFGYAKD